jgi:hypothetical protein
MAAAKYLGSNDRCRLCGRQLRSCNRTGYCTQTRECKLANKREWNKQWRDECRARQAALIAEGAIEANLADYRDRESVTCELCGQPTRSKTGVCTKTPDCRAEHDRRHQRIYLATPEVRAKRLEAVHRSAKAAGPRVYAVHFPASRIAKVGFTDSRAHVSGAAGQLRETAVDLWQRPGDYRYEAYIQACLSFEFPQVRPPGRSHRPSRGGVATRISEWFDVSSVLPERLIVILNEIYEQAARLEHGDGALRSLTACEGGDTA